MDEYWVVDDSLEGYEDGVPTTSWPTFVEQWFREHLNPWDQLGSFFAKFDEEGFGEMIPEQFRRMLIDDEFRAAISTMCGDEAWLRLQAHSTSPRATDVTYQEFVDVLSNKRRRSFKVAVHQRDGDIESVDNFTLERERLPFKNRMAYKIADEFLADPYERKYYADQYKCWPPPVFIPLISIVELVSYVYYSHSENVTVNGPVPQDSIFIFRPDKRIEVWRFVTYAFLHAGWLHLIHNILVQLLLGLLLECIHGSARIAIVYFAGVIAGSLATSVFDQDAYLVGASGGVFALIAAHAANVLLNYSQLCCVMVRIFVIFLVASLNVGYAIYDRYATASSNPPVSYAAHLAGSLAGLTIGLLVLRKFEQRFNEQFVWCVALAVYCACMLTAIIWNIFFL